MNGPDPAVTATEFDLDPTDDEITAARTKLDKALAPFAYGAPSHIAAVQTLGTVQAALDFAAQGKDPRDTAAGMRSARAAIRAYDQWHADHIASLHAKRQEAVS